MRIMNVSIKQEQEKKEKGRGRRGGKRKKKKGGRRKETLARKQVKKTGKGHGGFNSKFQFHTSYLSRKRKRGRERRGRGERECCLLVLLQ